LTLYWSVPVSIIQECAGVSKGFTLQTQSSNIYSLVQLLHPIKLL